MNWCAAFRFWFCMLLVQSAVALVSAPVGCVVSGGFNLTRPVENKDGDSCWEDCVSEPQCHMAVLVRVISGPPQCLLVTCQNQSRLSDRGPPSTESRLLPRNTSDRVVPIAGSSENSVLLSTIVVVVYVSLPLIVITVIVVKLYRHFHCSSSVSKQPLDVF